MIAFQGILHSDEDSVHASQTTASEAVSGAHVHATLFPFCMRSFDDVHRRGQDDQNTASALICQMLQLPFPARSLLAFSHLTVSTARPAYSAILPTTLLHPHAL